MMHWKLTRWVTMHEAVPVTRPLQNHFPLFTHFTTHAALWIPQYLEKHKLSASSVAATIKLT